MTHRVLIATLGIALFAVPVQAQPRNDGGVSAAPTGYRPAADIEEQIGAELPLGLYFRDENEQPVTLGECMGGKTTILVPVYYRCPMLCNELLNGLLEALIEMPQDYSVGDQFNVVTISMDPREHCDLAREKKKTYLGQYGRPGGENGWRFLTGSKESIAILLDTVGYRFEFDKVFKEYNHPSGIIIVTPSGKVSRYFYGITYSEQYKETFKVPGGTTTLRLSLVEASEGKMGSLIDQAMLLCYRFDNLHKGYKLSILRAVQLGGILTVVLLGTGVFIALRRERRRAALVTETTLEAPPSGGNT